jgi:hypothetical protein
VSREAFTPRQPDFILAIKTKSGPEKKGRVGAGWKNDDGNITLQLNPGIVLSWKDDIFLSLFPADFKAKRVEEPEPEPDPGPAWRG